MGRGTHSARLFGDIVTQLPSDNHRLAQAQNRAKRAKLLAVPALVLVSAVAWIGIEAARGTATPQLVYSPAPPPVAAERVITVIKTPMRQTEQARLTVQADTEEPLNNVVELAQIDEQRSAPTAPTPSVKPPEPEPAAATPLVQIEPVSATVEVDDCASKLRRFAQDQIIRFSIGRADLEDGDLPVLRRIGRMAEDCPNVVVQVKGHSDSTGSDVINLALSWQRADNTIATLAALGIDTRNFEPIGFGARAPLAQGDASDDDFNRRVEFQVFKTEETQP